MPAPRVCVAESCGAELVRRGDEPKYNFEHRQTCNRTCQKEMRRERERVRAKKKRDARQIGGEEYYERQRQGGDELQKILCRKL